MDRRRRFLLAHLAVGAIAAHRLVSRARPVRDSSWRQLLKDAQEMAGVTGAVRLYESGDVGMPVTLGVFRPTIVLPPLATSWSEERRLTVLVHELAHIVATMSRPVSRHASPVRCTG